MELGPDETEVLIAATELALQDKRLDAARKHIDQGLDLHRENPFFYLMAADLEQADNHPDRAETFLRRGIAAVPAPFNADLKLLLVENLISEHKLDGDDGAISWIERVRRLGLAPGYAQYLEGRVSMADQKWEAAIHSLEGARAVLAGDTVMTPRISLLLAECYRSVGDEDQREAAFRSLVDSGRAPDSVRIELARSLTRSDKLDQAIAMLLPVVGRVPEQRLELVSLLIQKTSRQARNQRNWQEVEQALLQAEKALHTEKTPSSETQKLVLLRADLLLAQDRPADALSVVSAAQRKDPRNLRYRLALARLTQRLGKSGSPPDP